MRSSDNGKTGIQYKNMSIGLIIVFICEIAQLFTNYMVVPDIYNEAYIIYMIIFDMALAVEAVGLFIAARDEESFKASAIVNITFLAVYFIYSIIDIVTHSEEEVVWGNNFMILLFDAMVTLFTVRAFINFYEKNKRSTRFLRITNIVVIVSTMIGVIAYLWSNTFRAMSAGSLFIFFLMYVVSIVCSYIFYLISIGRTIRDCVKERI